MFAGAGEIRSVGTSPRRCTVAFNTTDDVLGELRVATRCGDGEQIQLVFRPAKTEWRLDRDRSLEVENDDCGVSIATDVD